MALWHHNVKAPCPRLATESALLAQLFTVLVLHEYVIATAFNQLLYCLTQLFLSNTS